MASRDEIERKHQQKLKKLPNDKYYDIMLLGANQVGKTHFGRRFAILKASFNESEPATWSQRNFSTRMLVDLDYGMMGLDECVINVTLKEVPEGQSTHYSYTNKEIVIVMFDVNNKNTWNWAKAKIEQILKRWDWNELDIDERILVLIGNKMDEFKDDMIELTVEMECKADTNLIKCDLDEIDKFVKEKGIYHYNISLKDIYSDNNSYLDDENPDMVYKIIHDILAKRYIQAYPKIQKSTEGTCNTLSDIIYDTVTIIISFADLITDLIMLYNYYTIPGRKAFFVLSLIVIILAQLSYCVLFTGIFGSSESYKCGERPNQCSLPKKIPLFFKCIPFAPILSAIIYFGSNEDGCFAQKILKDKFGFTIDEWKPNRNTSELEKWFNKKIKKHCGFILESVLEAFPNAILQMIAIVIYREANMVAIISILLSMTSVSTKAMIFSRSIDSSVFLFNWLCACADFFGIFWTISWVFYNTDIHLLSDNQLNWSAFINSFNFIGQLWIYKMISTLIPITLLVGTALLVGFVCVLFFEYIYDECSHQIKLKRPQAYRYKRCCTREYRDPCGVVTKFTCLFGCTYIFMVIGMIIVYCIGMALGIIVIEILNYILLAGLLFVLIEMDTIPTYNAHDYYMWKSIEKFVKGYKSHRDRLLRIICVNRILFHNNIARDKPLNKYLKEQQNNTDGNNQLRPFSDVTFKKLLLNCAQKANKSRIYLFYGLLYELTDIFMEFFTDSVSFWKDIRRGRHRGPHGYTCGDWGDMFISHVLTIATFVATFILFPLYVLSRFFKVLLPIITLIYLSINNLWSSTEMFQLFMLSFYLIIIFSIWILAVPVFTLYHSLWHIQPGGDKSGVKDMSKAIKAIENINKYYMDCQVIPIRKQILCNHFGNDIGGIIETYCTRFDDWD